MPVGTFERHEIKFILNSQQRHYLECTVCSRLRPDEHGESTVCNIYYDTPDYLLVRRSLDRPVYKEKIRLRSYGPVWGEAPVFLELKKKYDGVVYKRRIELPLEEAEAFLDGASDRLPDCQIGREIEYFCHSYRNLEPAVHLSYERCAFYDRTDPDLRLTFDRNIRWQTEDCRLSALPFGRSLLAPGESLLEIKTASALPLWLVSVLSEAEIRKNSFSKYGTAYLAMLQYDRMRGVSCA